MLEIDSSQLYPLAVFVGKRDFKYPASTFDTCIHQAWDLLSFLFRIFFLDIRSLEAGYSEQEFGVKMNTSLFTVCTVTLAAGLDCPPQISRILYIGPTEESIIKQINSSLQVMTVQSIILLISTGILAVVGYISLQDVMKSVRESRLRNMANQALGNSAALNAEDEIKLDGYLCQACKFEPRCLLFIPCKHMLFCRDCWNALPEADKAKCNKCHKKIDSTTHLFMT